MDFTSSPAALIFRSTFSIVAAAAARACSLRAMTLSRASFCAAETASSACFAWADKSASCSESLAIMVTPDNGYCPPRDSHCDHTKAATPLNWTIGNNENCLCVVYSSNAMSALGQKQTYAVQNGMSALPPIATAKADPHPASRNDKR